MSKRAQKYMQRALELAKQGEGKTNPNPMVGAVLVKNDVIIGEGWHERCGEAHAEIRAFADVANRLKILGGLSNVEAEAKATEWIRGAHMYVTLEPCSHYGKTPPCAVALIEKGIGRVVVAMVDPNPRVAGRGIAMLEEKGIEVEVGVLEKEAAQLNEIFIHHITKGTPFVAIKTAMTLDGKICTVSGASKWITGPESRERVHQLRNKYSAILVGVGTVLADNPSLTTRLAPIETTGKDSENGVELGRNPLRVVLDGRLKTPLDAKVFDLKDELGRPVETLLITTAKAPFEKIQSVLEKGVSVQICQRGNVEIAEVLKVLSDRGIDSVLVEGGSEVNASFMEARAVHKIYAFMAPKIIGGLGAKGPFGGKGKANLSEAWEIEKMSVKTYGKDILIEGYVNQEETLCLQG